MNVMCVVTKNLADCIGCGACCKFIMLPVNDLTEDIKKWLELHGVEVMVLEEKKYLIIQNECVYLDNNSCKAYVSRPSVCANFKAGSALCQASKVYISKSS